MSRHTTFSFTLVPSREQEQALRRHVGASRFAFNQCLRLVMNALEAKRQAGKNAEAGKVPWSGFDLINAFNAWKRSEAAGGDEAGAGLVWRAEVCQQVFEEAAVDLGRALEGFSAGRKGERQGKPPRFPKFKRKATARQSFRLRNKGSGTAAAIRVGEQEQARVVRLPRLGSVRVRESTRRLRRMLRKGRAKILFATVSTREGGRWRVSLNVEGSPLHPERRPRRAETSPAGIDRGLSTFAVVADAEGHELERIDSPRPLRTLLPKLRRKSRALSRKQKGSRNRYRARQRLSRVHGRIRNIRHDFLRRHSTQLAQTHDSSRLTGDMPKILHIHTLGLLEAAWRDAQIGLDESFTPLKSSVPPTVREKLIVTGVSAALIEDVAEAASPPPVERRGITGKQLVAAVIGAALLAGGIATAAVLLTRPTPAPSGQRFLVVEADGPRHADAPVSTAGSGEPEAQLRAIDVDSDPVLTAAASSKSVPDLGAKPPSKTPQRGHSEQLAALCSQALGNSRRSFT